LSAIQARIAPSQPKPAPAAGATIRADQEPNCLKYGALWKPRMMSKNTILIVLL
jgi:hypothetical protein